MEQSLDHTLAILARTPKALDALLRDLPDDWTTANEGAGTWDVREVVGHLIFAELTDWLPRVRMILDFGEKRPFEPFDRAGYDSSGKSLTEMLDEFAKDRGDGVSEICAMQLRPDQMNLRGLHPSLGTVTLSQLLATWAVHDLTHLHQISRILAYQYRDAVGSWSAYLGVLQCKGHSA